MSKHTIEVCHLGLQDYSTTFAAMQKYTRERDESTLDQIWVLEHPPVFTLGLAGDRQHLIDPHTDIPVIQVDRGGQITYHGPGQLVVYLLLNLKRHTLYVRELVHKMEQALIDTLTTFAVKAERKVGAPGIYLDANNVGFEHLAGAKIAALGLKVSRQCTYHGLSLNVNMDLAPFKMINPCGYVGMQTVDLATLNQKISQAEVAKTLIVQLLYQIEKDVLLQTP